MKLSFWLFTIAAVVGLPPSASASDTTGDTTITADTAGSGRHGSSARHVRGGTSGNISRGRRTTGTNNNNNNHGQHHRLLGNDSKVNAGPLFTGTTKNVVDPSSSTTTTATGTTTTTNNNDILQMFGTSDLESRMMEIATATISSSSSSSKYYSTNKNNNPNHHRSLEDTNACNFINVRSSFHLSSCLVLSCLVLSFACFRDEFFAHHLLLFVPFSLSLSLYSHSSISLIVVHLLMEQVLLQVVLC